MCVTWTDTAMRWCGPRNRNGTPDCHFNQCQMSNYRCSLNSATGHANLVEKIRSARLAGLGGGLRNSNTAFGWDKRYMCQQDVSPDYLSLFPISVSTNWKCTKDDVHKPTHKSLISSISSVQIQFYLKHDHLQLFGSICRDQSSHLKKKGTPWLHLPITVGERTCAGLISVNPW